MWRDYVFELRDRIQSPGERMGGMVLAAPGNETNRWGDVEDLKDWIAFYDGVESYDTKSIIFASPTSDRLAAVLVQELRARKARRMNGLHLVFVGTRAEGEQVRSAAEAAGAKVTLVDRAVPYPAGEPLPDSPSPLWTP